MQQTDGKIAVCFYAIDPKYFDIHTFGSAQPMCFANRFGFWLRQKRPPPASF